MILVLDFGSQFTQLIARHLQSLGLTYAVESPPFDLGRISSRETRGVILSGSPSSVTQEGSPLIPEVIFSLKVPVLGICYGQQILCAQYGGQIEAGVKRGFGPAVVEITDRCELFDGLWQVGEKVPVWASYGDCVTRIPDGFRSVAAGDGIPGAIIANDRLRYYGVQFHPEVAHTPDGRLLLTKFASEIAGCQGDQPQELQLEKLVNGLREQIGGGRVICAVSGGVDSAVTALLLHRAIGDRVVCLLIDNGLLREGESDDIRHIFRSHYSTPLLYRDYGKLFLERLVGVTDPECKRKIIGTTFIEVFEHEAWLQGQIDFLAQGTLHPDVIESIPVGGGPSAKIKSHHNVGGLPEHMKLKLVEPLRSMFKDQVRTLAKQLELPAAFIKRHPFPGPGLAIRIVGEITGQRLSTLRQADAIYLEELRKGGIYDDIWQAFAVLLPVYSVGVMGDARTYQQVLALRAITSSDGMTAQIYPFDPEFLSGVAARIINEVEGINRVTYDLTSKPPATVEWE